MKLKLINIYKVSMGWFKKRPPKVRIILILFLLLIAGWSGYRIINRNTTATQYQTAMAEKGTLITSISGSGSITSGNNTGIITKVSGVVDSVYVTNGNTVKKGQKIAEIKLDDYARERQTAAWVAYLDATVAVKEAVNAKAVVDIQMWKDRQVVLDAQEAVNDMNDDDTNPATHEVYTEGERMIITKTLDQTRKAFTVSEAKYLNAGADIANANAQVAAALRNYQENSSTIIAPADGVISDLMLAPGVVVNASSATSNTSGATIVSAQTIGKISSKGQLIATVNLSEVDIVSVKANQKVSLTLDAFPDMSFTGKVLAVNTSGSVSSGVTSYPVTILLDPVTVDIYPNMSVNAEIITSIKNDVILIPSTAISTANGESTIQVKKDGKYTTVQVETGSANDSQTEIVSGINEGDEVVTSVITAQSSNQTGTDTTSPFSGVGRGSNTFNRGTIRIEGSGPPGGF
jgi:multidrug efflux pump subunit AcrA (membrane-fusion protein)